MKIKSEKIEPKSEYNEKTRMAIDLIKELMNLNLNIEGKIWMSAFYYILITGCRNSGITYDEFVNEFMEMVDFYKKRGFFDTNELEKRIF